jgi:hypothetical protein
MSGSRIYVEDGSFPFMVLVRLADGRGEFTKTVHVSAKTPEKARDYAFDEVQGGSHVFRGFEGRPMMIM